MKNVRRLLGLLLLLCLAPCAVAQDDALGDEPPIVGRPAEFSGAVGSFAAVATSVDRKELPAQSPLVLVVTITAGGPVASAPGRPSLKKWSQFSVEGLPGPVGAPAGPIWEFRYQLKPLSTDVKEVPALEFVYYKPGIRPASKGYQTLYADSIPLTVTPAKGVDASAVQGGSKPPEPPESILSIATGVDVLRSRGDDLPPVPWLVIFALGPPLGCWVWYITWRKLYPDALARNRQQRSRAAQKALVDLERARRGGTEDLPLRMGEIFAGYLQQRWDLPVLQPTPEEVADHLRRVGRSPKQSESVAGFLRLCDQQRYAPATMRGRFDGPKTARTLILELETDACMSQGS